MKLGEKQEKTVSPVVSKVALDSNKLGRLLTSELELNTDVQILGSIYKQLLIAERLDIDDKISMHDQLKKERDNEKTRNDEIIRALTGRKRKKEPKKEEVVEKKKTTKEEPKKEAPAKEKAKEPQKAPKEPQKVPKKEAPKPEKAPAPSTPSKPSTTVKVPPVTISGNKGLVISALIAAGLSTSAQSNILANVDKESNFNPRSEEMPSAEKIYAMFGGPEVGKTKNGRPLNKSGNIIRFPTMEDVKNTIAKGPEEYFNKVYDGRMGNNNPGDGYKYRGRGFIQITGKDMYQRIGKMIGVDLVNNPDLANEPTTAAKIIPAFFQLKIKEIKGNISDLENIDTVNSTVGSADVKSKEARKVLAQKYKSELGVPTNQSLPESLTTNTGLQIDQSSKENASLKKSLSKNGNTTIVNNQVNSPVITGGSQSSSGSAPDDRSAIQKKANK